MSLHHNDQHHPLWHTSLARPRSSPTSANAAEQLVQAHPCTKDSSTMHSILYVP